MIGTCDGMSGVECVDHLAEAVAAQEDRESRRCWVALVQSDDTFGHVKLREVPLPLGDAQGGAVGGQLLLRLGQLVAGTVIGLDRGAEPCVEGVHLAEHVLCLRLLVQQLLLRRGGQRLTDEGRAENGGRDEREYDPPGTHGEVGPPSPR